MISSLLARLAPARTDAIPVSPQSAPATGLAAARPSADTPRRRARLRDWAELLRVSALFTVPGDALAGAAAVGMRPNRGTALAMGASLCLYEAGMALNDWADTAEDAVDRPHRPIPSGRISPRAALGAAGVLTAAGLTLAARAGRPALAVATVLSATVWAYDLRLKHTKAGPSAMAAARGLDVLLGATATMSATHGVPPWPSGRGLRRGPDRSPVPSAPGPVPAAALVRPVRRGAVAWRAGGALPFGAAAALEGAPAGPPRRGAGAVPAAGFARRVRRGAVVGGAGARPAWSSAETGAVPSGAFTRGARGRGTAPTAEAVRVAATRQGALAEFSVSRRGPGEGWGGGSSIPARTALRAAAPAAAMLAAHTYAVTSVSRHEAQGGSTLTPVAALAGTAVLGVLAARPRGRAAATVSALLAAAYLRTAATGYLHAALNPSPPLTQRAVGGGIRAMIPFQAALAARSGAGGIGLAVMGLVPLARTLARKVSVT